AFHRRDGGDEEEGALVVVVVAGVGRAARRPKQAPVGSAADPVPVGARVHARADPHLLEIALPGRSRGGALARPSQDRLPVPRPLQSPAGFRLAHLLPGIAIVKNPFLRFSSLMRSRVLLLVLRADSGRGEDDDKIAVLLWPSASEWHKGLAILSEFLFYHLNLEQNFDVVAERFSGLQVVWGEATMIEAERLLLAVALKDPDNQRFALISDR
ncbi:hypothetical protein B296_00057389, partial [Ensete ventricosum]